MPMCELCGKEQAKYVAQERSKPNRELLLGEDCRKKTKHIYREPFYDVYELSGSYGCMPPKEEM